MIIRLFKMLLGVLAFRECENLERRVTKLNLALFQNARSIDRFTACGHKTRKATCAIPRRDGNLGSVTNEKADCLAFTHYADDTVCHDAKVRHAHSNVTQGTHQSLRGIALLPE